uniref:MYND-type domain-containing protein n=1 Tax=Daphnia galeata TaxID=27404 RepID=A0A8J2WD58_9CRUS|nr:unnamed protein product [Daphnia galeata]
MGHLNAKEASEYLHRVFVKKNSKPMIVHTTDEGTKLLRYVLRLNSTKMKPSSWQENNLSLGKYSPFLATYISPLYQEKFYHCDEKEDDATSKTSDAGLNEASATRDSQPNTCAVCGKQSRDKFKRCSRCKITEYCTVECQRADWRKHKLAIRMGASDHPTTLPRTLH